MYFLGVFFSALTPHIPCFFRKSQDAPRNFYAPQRPVFYISTVLPSRVKKIVPHPDPPPPPPPARSPARPLDRPPAPPPTRPHSPGPRSLPTPPLPPPPPGPVPPRKVAGTIARCVVLYTSIHNDLFHCRVSSAVVSSMKVLEAGPECWDSSFWVGAYRLFACASLFVCNLVFDIPLHAA